MFSVKASGVAGGSALVLSLLIGIISGGNPLIVLFRAGVWGVIFFVLIAGLSVIINRFLPELLLLGQEDELQEDQPPGSQVDISVEDPKPADKLEPPEPVLKQDSSPVEAAPLDQIREKAYTQEKEQEEPEAPGAETQAAEPVTPSAKPLDPPPEEPPEEAVMPREAKPVPQKAQSTPKKGNAMDPSKLDPQQMASTIQTLLRQE